eukprot:gnl/TRDRNA2_/TRDRNA2_54325_c0_seq2.p1 gnl/TRDRNA2_/TRDRNA2_54325_c0~~gnl/TRDRNA2_/TRDRNA2_54325_c0_seq2.p1  ORF type:complete len:194 (+),score=12.29 gnl/TRDRNA2_/TRDRNA2_54325_c0_seq2:53-583(+)
MTFVEWLQRITVCDSRYIEVDEEVEREPLFGMYSYAVGVVSELDPMKSALGERAGDFTFAKPSDNNTTSNWRQVVRRGNVNVYPRPEWASRRAWGMFREAYVEEITALRRNTDLAQRLKTNERLGGLMSSANQMRDKVVKSLNPYFAWIQSVEVEGYFITIRRRKCLVGTAGCAEE